MGPRLSRMGWRREGGTNYEIHSMIDQRSRLEAAGVDSSSGDVSADGAASAVAIMATCTWRRHQITLLVVGRSIGTTHHLGSVDRHTCFCLPFHSCPFVVQLINKCRWVACCSLHLSSWPPSSRVVQAVVLGLTSIASNLIQCCILNCARNHANRF